MATPSMQGLLAELENYERELNEAINKGDEDRIRYLQERIRRINIEIENLKYYNKNFWFVIIGASAKAGVSLVEKDFQLYELTYPAIAYTIQQNKEQPLELGS